MKSLTTFFKVEPYKHIDRFIPAEIKNKPDNEDAIRRHRLVIAMIVVTDLFWFIGFFYFILTQAAVAWHVLSVFTIIFYTSLLYFLKHTGAYKTIVIIELIVSYAGLLLLSFDTGGIESPVIIWLLTSPLFTMMLLDVRAGIFNMALISALVVVYDWLQASGLLAVQRTPESIVRSSLIIDYILVTIFLTFIGWFYESVRSRTQGKLERELRERMQAEAALEKERASLAQRVAERTAELSATNKELAQALRTKDEFLATMSHELRTPLNGILGRTEVLQSDIYAPLSDKQSQIIQQVEAGGHRLLALIERMFDVVHMEGGKEKLAIQPILLEALCRSVLSIVQSASQDKQIKLLLTLDSTVEYVAADEDQLQKILIYLLENAIKFTPKNGRVGLEITGDQDENNVNLTVWDTGIGIAAEDIERLFQPFTQLDSRLARAHEGAGLGLALTRQYAEMHGGSVSVESKVGEGSRFTVSLPWTPAIQAA